MLDDLIIAYRELNSSGLSSTTLSVWEELYRKNILNPHVANKAWERSELTMGTQADFLEDISRSDDQRIQVPKKAWTPCDNFSTLKTHEVPPPDVYTIKNCVAFSPNGLTITSTGKVVADAISPPELLANRTTVAISKVLFEHGLRWTSNQFRKDSIEQHFDSRDCDIDVGCPLLPLWQNYYHWTAECLPRLREIEKHYRDTGEVITLLTPPDPPSWIVESLTLLSSDAYRTQEFTDKTYSIEKLVVPTYPDPSPESCRWLRETMNEKITSSCSVESDRIYISREQANRRRISNRDEIEDVLDKFGFESHVLENLSIEDQVQMFSGAKVVVAPHGAGLTNIIYSDNVSVIEIFGSKKKTTFHRLSEILGHDYSYIAGETDKADIRINSQDLQTAIEKMIVSK